MGPDTGYTLHLLASEELSGFASLSYRSFQPALRVGTDQVVAIGARYQSRPVGLLLGTKERNTVRVASIAVSEEHRRKNIATAMMGKFESEVPQFGYGRAELFYDESWSAAPVLARLLARCHWVVPEISSLSFTSSLESIQRALWLRRPVFPGNYEVFRWNDATDEDRTAADRLDVEASGLHPDMIVHSRHETSSLGLRVDGKLAGWSVSEQSGEETIRFSKLFVREDLRLLGRGPQLLILSILEAAAAGMRKGSWSVRADNHRMLRFVCRKLLPFIEETTSVWKSSKEFDGALAA